jgi:alcohol dehydrogenase class IV
VGGAGSVVPWLRGLKSRIGIVGGLASRGVTAAHLPRLCEMAAADFAGRTNPRPASSADYERLFVAAM